MKEKNQSKNIIKVSESILGELFVYLLDFLVQFFPAQLENLQRLFAAIILNFKRAQSIIQVPLNYVPLTKHACLG